MLKFQILYSLSFFAKILLFMQLILKILYGGKANIADTDQTAPLGAV